MKGFFEWFKSGTKMKRWILLILVGIALACYGISEIIVSKEINFGFIAIGKIVISFIIGFSCIVLGIIFINKRNLELMIEATDDRMENKKNVNVNSLIFNKTVYHKGPNIVVIGGGTGLNTVLSGIKSYTSNVTAIVTVSDYGKTPSNSREEMQVMPLEDVKDSIVALASKEGQVDKLFNYKFDSGKLKGISFSDIYFSAMKNINGNFEESVIKSNEVINMIGKVIPVTLEEMKICAELDNGYVIEDKDRIAEVAYDKVTKINRIFLNPNNCKPAPGVLDAIKNADCIVIGPGSLYTNVIPNLLVSGIAREIKDSKAIKIYVSNIMTEPGQTDYYTLSDHIKAIIEHTGKNVIDYCIYDTGEIIPEYIKRYNLKGSELVAQDVAKARTLGVRLLQRDLACIENGYIRHNPDLVAKAISELICDDLKYRDKQSDPQYMLLKSKLEYEKQFNKIKNKPKKKRKTNENKKGRKSKFLSKYGKRIEAMRNTEEVKLKNREILQNENKDKEEEFIEKFIEKVEQNKKK